jgi:hypothetical protein
MLSATVTPSSAVGTVSFKDGATVLGTATVNGGVAQLSVSSLTVGDHVLNADFVPTAVVDFLPSSAATVPITVQPAPPAATSVAVVTNPAGPAAQGTAVTITATVTPGSAPGTVQFLDADGTVTLGAPVAVSSGVATITLSSLGSGQHALSASFAPTGSDFVGSTSGTVTFLVTMPTTTDLLVTPTSPVPFGSPFSAAVTVAPSAAAGSVQILDGAAVVGTATVSSGTATVSVPGLAAGSHALRARFVPADIAVYASSTTAVVTVVVSAPPAQATTTTLAVTPISVSAGSVVTLTASVTPSSAFGVVRFTDGTTVLSTASVAGGTAHATTTRLAEGSHSIVATFVPTTSAYETSASAPVMVSISAAASVTVTDGDGSPLGAGATVTPSSTLILRCDGFVPGSLVTFTVHSTPVVLARVAADSSGSVTATVVLPSTLTTGAHTLTATSVTTRVTFAFSIAPATTGTGSGGTGSTGGSGSLSHTGADVGPIGLGGLGLVLVGGLLVVSGSRRRVSR